MCARGGIVKLTAFAAGSLSAQEPDVKIAPAGVVYFV
jgi:hypothetical protein